MPACPSGGAIADLRSVKTAESAKLSGSMGKCPAYVTDLLMGGLLIESREENANSPISGGRDSHDAGRDARVSPS